MAPIDTLVAFALATLIFGYVPGPAMLYAAAQTLARGRIGGAMAALCIFVDPGGALPVWAQPAILGTIVNLVFSSADVACVLLAGTVRARAGRSDRAQRVARAAGGSVLIGLGANLALQRQ